MKAFFPFVMLLSLFLGILMINNSLVIDNKNDLNENTNYKYILIEQPEWYFQDNSINSYKIKSSEAKRIKENGKIILSQPLIEINSLKKITHSGEALVAEIHPTINILSLQKKASIRSLSEEKNYELNSNQINIDRNKNTIFSSSKSTLKTEALYLKSNDFFLEKIKDNSTKITFSETEILKIDPSGKKKILGYSKKVHFFPEEKLLILRDSAKLFQDEITIQADEIRYDLVQEKILTPKIPKPSKEI